MTESKITQFFTCGIQIVLYFVMGLLTILALFTFGLPGLIVGILIWLCLVPIGVCLGMGLSLATHAVTWVFRAITAIVTFPFRWLSDHVSL